MWNNMENTDLFELETLKKFNGVSYEGMFINAAKVAQSRTCVRFINNDDDAFIVAKSENGLSLCNVGRRTKQYAELVNGGELSDASVCCIERFISEFGIDAEFDDVLMMLCQFTKLTRYNFKNA